ncbi:subtype A tannase [Branchiibius cervicis]|uniref:Subtype A tannase n=1 Tax=Branchiibius cervicis TaxID=908252 RepID=A0ABW2ASS4_9MICO
MTFEWVPRTSAVSVWPDDLVTWGGGGGFEFNRGSTREDPDLRKRRSRAFFARWLHRLCIAEPGRWPVHRTHAQRGRTADTPGQANRAPYVDRGARASRRHATREYRHDHQSPHRRPRDSRLGPGRLRADRLLGSGKKRVEDLSELVYRDCGCHGGGGFLGFNSKGWHYDSGNDVYYQLGVSYVAKPAAKDYETLGVYVPGKYLTGTKNSDGTYTAVVNTSVTVGGFTARTAPIVLPVNTPGYAAQKPPTTYSYNDVSSYLKAGFVYVAAGLRGKDSQSTSYHGNAPWGVTDLKAAIRYLRLNLASIPGGKDKVYVFGMSGGGAQSTIAGATGDSDLYTAHLNAIGAAMTDSTGAAISDAVNGVMAWCPITSLDYANVAYEWNMGQFATTGTRASGTWTTGYSGHLADAFATYVNKLKLKDGSGATLTLASSTSGHYLSGSYYDHLVSVINQSLNDFLSDTTFPYTPNTQTMAGMGGAGGSAGGPPADSSGGAPSGAPTGGGQPPSGATGGSPSSSSSTTYKTVADYISYLNTDSTWVTYDASTKKATVKDLAGFVKSQKNASKDVGAFDGPGADRPRTS